MARVRFVADNPDDHRPSFETLKALSEQIPGMAAGVATGKIGSKGLKQLPTKACQICGAGFDMAWQKDLDIGSLKDGVCPSCDGQLKQGMIALTDGTAYAFVKSPELKDHAGQIMRVSNKTMLLIKAKEADNKIKKNGHN